MKFSNVLFFASMVMAAPTMYEKPQLDTRQTTVIGTINNIVNTLTNTTATNIQNINTAVAALQNNVDATVVVHLQGVIRANLKAIAIALQEATTDITAATVDAVAAVGGDVNKLTASQLAQLKAAVDAATVAIGNISASVSLVVTGVTPAVAKFLKSETTAVTNAIRPFIEPIFTFVNDLRNAGASASVVVTGLTGILSLLLPIAQVVLANLGLDQLVLPV
ncbi:hypothetical protein EDB81DRAFT_854249 [Dactylonectria macrodidyma]|uniref:Uncharacterized protein n=1 Tax=Dactylonectria macrodidyma TaxID=307937 RepID=A0A9P9F9U7_9HYPO|nr:hypothetical protein EDB81DRAFT_854249 [Dactylonectria macrodidyma]